jgi:drug/metabolite transporter (DMT)-like permease
MHLKAYLLLTLTMLVWGGNTVAGKLAVGHVSPMLLTALRWGLPIFVLAPFCLVQLRRDWPVLRRNMLVLFLLGAVGFGFFNAVFYSALLYTSAVNVSIEQAGMPMFIFMLNFALFRIQPNWAQLVGFGLSLFGVILTATHGDLTSLASLRINYGDALMIFAALLYAGYTVGLRYRPNLPWQSMMPVMYVSGFLGALPFVAWEIASGEVVWPDLQGWSVVAYSVLFASILSQLFYIWSVEMIGANRAGVFINLSPIFGTLLSVVILAEAFHLYHAIALTLVLSGIALAEHTSRKNGGS